ncbi:MAG: GNAT family N-acetyltransferase [Candidatus Rokubacteria bacterium]|nr:GNAT family N-acetyltransferase [Candidatus Rokubacteria bacterium]
MKVESLSGFDGLDAAGWNALVAASSLPSVFLSWQWQTAWAHAFLGDRALQLFTVSEDSGALVGLLPLYEEAAGPLMRLVGGVDVSDYLDLIAPAGREEEIWGALLEHRAPAAGEWDLHGIRAASPTLALLPVLAPPHGLGTRIEREERCPVLALPPTWEAYLARLSGKDRHELRRKMRRLEAELPGTELRSVAGPDGWDDAMTEFLRLHRLSRAGKARFMDEAMERFFRDALRALAEAGWARLWFLDSGGAPIAAFLCLEYGGAVGLYNSGFDPTRARLAPGIVLLGHVIRDAIERGIAVFDFLRGEEAYKYAFGPVPADLFTVRVAP